MSDNPIGVFDSGLGGLTAVKELTKVLPNEDIIYFGDTSRVPYGNRSKETIKRYAMQDAYFLLSKNVKMIIAACGTVSSVAVELDEELPVPFTGVVKPTALAAVKATKNGRIGVIGTTATINSNSYQKEIQKQNKDLYVISQDCPLFVPLVENGFISKDDEIVRLIIERYLKKLKDEKVDTIILGCTHYPIIKNAISYVMGDNITLIDSGKETACFSAEIIKGLGLQTEKSTKGNCHFYVSDTTEGFSKNAELFLGTNVSHNVDRIDIEKY